MATSSPFSFLGELLDRASRTLQPPAWAVEEFQRRLVLLLNHVLMQEEQAMERLARHAGRAVRFQWRQYTLHLQATPAGLLDLADALAVPDLTLTVAEDSPAALARGALRGEKPGIRIEGDVQLAADVNWLIEHVRWDIEEDLSRLIGDAPAHALGQAGRAASAALRKFVAFGKKAPR
ncbi:SCP2 sterol-binding domain-containing protein [Pseudorhodoferax sp.]|uniref:SCP2 sterol-binding domain-containing protein n=1 Tax=Pseudorhodoferax sp. TaxID=1993553 RepID=UPI0039E48D3E